MGVIHLYILSANLLVPIIILFHGGVSFLTGIAHCFDDQRYRLNIMTYGQASYIPVTDAEATAVYCNNIIEAELSEKFSCRGA